MRTLSLLLGSILHSTVRAGGACTATDAFLCACVQLIRDIAGDIVERVELFDQFHNKKTSRHSHAYRIEYRHMDRSLTNDEVNALQELVRLRLVEKLCVDLR
jgi:phenylalanyl-tRNA synthetase beta subunit